MSEVTIILVCCWFSILFRSHGWPISFYRPTTLALSVYYIGGYGSLVIQFAKLILFSEVL